MTELDKLPALQLTHDDVVTTAKVLFDEDLRQCI